MIIEHFCLLLLTQDMVKYTPAQRWFVTRRKIHNVMRVVDIQRAFTTTYGIPAPSARGIRHMLAKADNNHNLQNLHPKRSGRKRSTRSFENTMMIYESVTDTPKLGQRPRSAMLGIHRSSLQRIMKLDLKFRAYRLQRKHKLIPNDHTRRATFANDFIAKHTEHINYYQLLYDYTRVAENTVYNHLHCDVSCDPSSYRVM